MTFSFKIEGVSDLFIARGGNVIARFILSIVFDTVDSFVPEGVGGGGALPIIAYTRRLLRKGIPLSRLKYGQTPQIWALKELSVLDVLTGLNFEKM